MRPRLDCVRLDALLHFARLPFCPLDELLRIARTRGELPRVQLGSFTEYLVWKPEHLHHVLVDRTEVYTKHTPSYLPLEPVFGRSVLTAEAAQWRNRRRLAQPFFHRAQLGPFAEAMADCAGAMVDAWDGDARRGAARDVWRDLMQLALRVVGRVVFGAELVRHATRVHESLTAVLHWLNVECYRPVREPAWLPTPRKLRLRRQLARLYTVLDPIIDDREREPRNDDFVSALCHGRDEHGAPLSRQAIRDELMTMLFAGHETTANAIAFTLYELARHPEHADRARAEVHDVVDRGPITAETVECLPYTRASLEEALRLYPPAWGMTRRCQQDDRIGDHVIERGALVWVSPWVTHRMPELWPEPERYRPERFVSNTGEPRHKLSYLPFLIGPRQCLGKVFALLEGQIALATILRRFRFALQPGYEMRLQPLLTLRPRHKLPLVLSPVERSTTLAGFKRKNSRSRA